MINCSQDISQFKYLENAEIFYKTFSFKTQSSWLTGAIYIFFFFYWI